MKVQSPMKNNNNKNLILEEYESEFSYTRSKSNLNISFNRIAFIFFVFTIVSIKHNGVFTCLCFSVKNASKIKQNHIFEQKNYWQ